MYYLSYNTIFVLMLLLLLSNNTCNKIEKNSLCNVSLSDSFLENITSSKNQNWLTAKIKEPKLIKNINEYKVLKSISRPILGGGETTYLLSYQIIKIDDLGNKTSTEISIELYDCQGNIMAQFTNQARDFGPFNYVDILEIKQEGLKEYPI